MYNELYDCTDYQQGLDMCLALLYDCDEMWVCETDFQNSKGCMAEIKFCKKNNIPIKVFFNNNIYINWEDVKIE